MLLPPQFKDEALKTLGPPLRKEEEKKPVEVYIGNGVWRVNGKLETRIPENEEADQHPWYQINPQSYQVSEIDIPLPELRIIGIDCGRSDALDAFVYTIKWEWK